MNKKHYSFLNTFNIERRSFWNHENVSQNRMENSEHKETEET